MKNINLAIVVSLGVFLAACEGKESLSSDTSNKNGLVIETIGKFEGCTINRFRDERLVYFLHCPDNKNPNIQAMWREGCGKNCTRPVSVRTIF